MRVNRAELLRRMAGVFARSEPWQQVGKYLDGVASDLPRKNGWTLAEHAGDGTPDRMQRLLNHAVWDHQQAMGVVRGFVAEHPAGPGAVVVIDESGQEKAGAATVGVKRQYVGCAGKITNAVNVVCATWASCRGHAPVGARLYLPAEWADDPKRRASAGVPEHVEFATKPELAVQILAELDEQGQLPDWLTGDEVYGQNPTLRSWCEGHDLGYVLGIPCSFTVTLGCGSTMRADQATTLVAEHGWNYRLYRHHVHRPTVPPLAGMAVRSSYALPSLYASCYAPSMGALPSVVSRLRLREDVRFVPFPDGVYLHGDHGTCMLRGRHAYDLMSRLAPVLDGSRTLAELTAALPDHQRSTVDRLVRELVAHRMVVDDLAASPHELTETELSVYAQEIAFIGYARDSPEHRFQRVRRARTVLIGEGPITGALVEALVGSGWRDLLVISSEPVVADAPFGFRRDSAQRVRTALPGSDSARPDAADLLVMVADDPTELVDLCRACSGSGTALATVLVRPDEAWLAPVGPPERTGAESGWRRLAPAPAAGRSGAAEENLTGPVPAVIAAMVTLACFARLTGLDERHDPDGDDPAPVLTRVDLRNLDTRTHRFLRHPMVAGLPAAAPSGDEAADAARAKMAALASGAPLTAEEVLDQTESLVDSRLGAVATLDEEALAQVPLSVCRARFRDPGGGLPSWSPLPEVIGWGEDRRVARLRALLGALAGYAHHATRTMPTSHGRVWGTELPSGVTLHSIQPSEAGQPALPAGLGAGLSWDQALAAGLRGHCEELVSHRGTTAGEPTAALPDTHLARLVGMTREPVEIRDRTGVLGVPAYAFTMAGEVAVVSAAATAKAAMHDGLERLLLWWQSRTRRQSAYRRVRPRWYDPAPATEPTGDPYGIRLMADALRRCGQLPVAVPLHGDPELARLVPYLVEVVLVRA